MLRCSRSADAYAANCIDREPSVPSILRRLLKNQRAATLIEYSLIAGLIATATVTGMGAVGNGLRNVMTSVSNAMN
jgi:pilus assembly protein Flp/PilA